MQNINNCKARYITSHPVPVHPGTTSLNSTGLHHSHGRRFLAQNCFDIRLVVVAVYKMHPAGSKSREANMYEYVLRNFLMTSLVLKGIYLYLLSVVAAQSIVLDGTTSFHRFKYGVFS